MLTPSSSQRGHPSSLLFGSRPFLRLHPPNYHLYVRLQGWRGVQQKLCQAHLQSLRLIPPILLAPLSRPRDEIDLSQPQVTGRKRLFLLSKLLPHEKNAGGVFQRVVGLLRLRSWALKRLFGLAWDHWILWRDLHPRIESTRAQNWG